MSTRFGILKDGILKDGISVESDDVVCDEMCIIVAIRHNGGRIEFRTDTSHMADNLQVYPLNNSRQGIETIGDLRRLRDKQTPKSAFCLCFNWAGADSASYLQHHPDCDGQGNRCESQPELQLLVIDLGDSRVVKVERGYIDLSICHTFDVNRFTMLSGHSFDKVKQAIEGNKPVPRIERCGIDPENFALVQNHRTNGIDGQCYEALSQLAGKPLPIWEGGTWTELPVASEHTANDSGITIWRYTR